MHKFETVEERIRNAISPMWNLAEIIKNLQDQNKTIKEKQVLYDFLVNSIDMPKIMIHNMKYLISIANEVDKYLPKDFSINEHVVYDYETNGLP